MSRTLTTMLLLSCMLLLIIAPSAVLGADRPAKRLVERATIPARFAPVYGFPDARSTDQAAPVKGSGHRSLNGYASGFNPDTIGTTTYDYQHNCTMGRQVEHRNYNYVHFDWMQQDVAVYAAGSLRGIGYQAYELSSCSYIFARGGIRIDADRAGYVTIDADPGGWAVPGAHETNAGIYYSRAYWDYTPGGPAFGVFTSDYSLDNCGWYTHAGINCDDDQSQNSWPKLDWDIDGAEEVVHMVACENSPGLGDPQTLSYYQRVGPYGVDQGTWSDQRVIDTVMNINVNVASSPISDRVAIVWLPPVDYLRDTPNEFNNQYENDLWYAMATDNGADWAANPTNQGNPSIAYQIEQGVYDGGNITQYAPAFDYRAYCNVSALFSTINAPSDELNIAWVCRRWDDTTTLYRRQGAVFHWAENSPTTIRTVVKANWDSGGACFAHDWGTDVDKAQISQCDGKLYVLFTQFGKTTNPCGDVDNVGNVVNGYLYMTVFDPVYAAWDRPQRVTNTPETPTGCTAGTMSGPGTCNSEYWASMARYGRVDTCRVTPHGDVLDIIYINDYAPGAAFQVESGVWTVNPIMWVTYPCRDAVPEPGYSDDAGPGYGLCVGQPILVAPTTGNTSFALTTENFGLLDNVVSVAARIDSGGNGNTEIGVNPAGGTITFGGGALSVTVTITTTGETNNVTVHGTITVTHQAVGSPRRIPVCITVSNEYVPLMNATIETTCKRLRVYNNGQLSNNATNASLDFTGDPDDCANIYLYDASPIVCRDVGGAARCYFVAYDNDYASDHALRQISPLMVDAVSHVDYTYATAEFITGDSTIGLIAEYFAPKAQADCGFVIQKLKFWNRTGGVLNDVAVGEVLDFDVPTSLANSNNESGYDQSRELIYQYGCGQDECDTLLANERYGGIAAWKDKPFKNYMTLENDVYVYSSGPFGNDAPLPDDTIYHLMSNLTGFHPAELDTCQDLTTLVTYDLYDLQPNDTECVVKILSTSREDANGSALKSNVDRGNAFINAHAEMKCPLNFVCDCRPGDANGDGGKNVGDAVYLISYIFKGGAAPTPYAKCSGDANGDCSANVGDAVYLISYIFKGGAAPVSCDTWKTNCGLPLRK